MKSESIENIAVNGAEWTKLKNPDHLRPGFFVT